MDVDPLWRHLSLGAMPDDIIDYIIAKVLDDPPFITLNSLCQVCKRWRQVLFSNRYLVYVHSGELRVLHGAKTTWWETVSLQFCQVELPGLSLENLELVFLRSGLLCLSTDVDGEFVFCNPLTKRCKRLRRDASQPISDASLIRSNPIITTWRVSVPHRDLGSVPRVSAFSSLFQDVKFFHSDNFQMFRLMLHSSSHERRPLETTVYQVRSGRKLPIAAVQSDLAFCVSGSCLEKAPSGNLELTLGCSYIPDRAFRVIEYDVTKRLCWKMDSLISPLDRLARSGRDQLFAKIFNDNEFVLVKTESLTAAFYAVDSQPQRISIYFMMTVPPYVFVALLSPAIREKELEMNLVQFEEDNVLCCVSILRSSRGSPRPVDYMSVGICHDHADLSCTKYFGWTEWAPGVDDEQIVENFHVLRPTYASPFLNCDQLFQWTGLRFPG